MWALEGTLRWMSGRTVPGRSFTFPEDWNQRSGRNIGHQPFIFEFNY